MQNTRTVPNILVTGTPGVGKSTLCQRLSEMTGSCIAQAFSFTILLLCLVLKDNYLLCK